MTALEQIRQEITATVDKVRAADKEKQQHEQDTQNRLTAAREKMSVALDAGDLESYKAAGMEAEQIRLELEFLEKTKERSRRPNAATVDDNRVRGSLAAEAARIRTDTFAQLRTIFGEAADMAAEGLEKLSELDKLLSEWDLIVMNSQTARKVSADTDRLLLAQIQNVAKAQIKRVDPMQ